MLQIISKKFFKNKKDSSSYFETPSKAIVYSNIDILDCISSKIVKLEKIERYNDITTYVLTYINVIEKQSNSGFQLVSIGHQQVVSDFLCCCTFWFKGIFTTDKSFLEKLIMEKREGLEDIIVPSEILPRFFSKGQRVTEEDIILFNDFISNIIGLERSTYKEVMMVIRQYNDALTTIKSNLELAYTMFVASIESLTQKFDGFETSWEDCPDKLVKKLELVFSELDEMHVSAIKKIIREEFHARLARRYEEFCLKNIDANFFRKEAIGCVSPIRKSYLKTGIKNSYILRSKYVHSLKELPDLVKLGGEAEMYIDGKMVFFTFSGLSRLCHHIICTFIKNSIKVETEDYNYFNELPGSFMLKMAPEYWIYKEENLMYSNLTSFASEFLQYHLKVIREGKDICDCTSLCKKIERMLKQTNNKNHKLMLILIYTLYNLFISHESKIKGWDKVVKANENILDEIGIESIVLHLLTVNEFPWSKQELEDYYDKYSTNKMRKNSLKIPQIIEICWLLEMANACTKVNQHDRALYFIVMACDEKPGDSFIMDLEKQAKIGQLMIIDWRKQYFRLAGESE